MNHNLELLDLLRIVCGLFFLPHLVLKFVFFDDTLEFFKKAGFPFAKQMILLDAAVEAVVAPMLIANIYPSYAAFIASMHLLVAGSAVWRANGHTWRWNRGGPEYAFFWSIMCLLIARGYWH
jgi:putative oxidoreductase